MGGQVAATLLIGSEVPRANARSFYDPIVRGLDPLLSQFSGKVGVAQASLGQIAARAQNA
jgi:hypothetical protein